MSDGSGLMSENRMSSTTQSIAKRPLRIYFRAASQITECGKFSQSLALNHVISRAVVPLRSRIHLNFSSMSS